jgi:hypothetical protein
LFLQCKTTTNNEQEEADSKGKDITNKPTGAGLVLVLVIAAGQAAEVLNQVII